MQVAFNVEEIRQIVFDFANGAIENWLDPADEKRLRIAFHDISIIMNDIQMAPDADRKAALEHRLQRNINHIAIMALNKQTQMEQSAREAIRLVFESALKTLIQTLLARPAIQPI